ncbi:Fe-S cluster assembly sulfur transfer protein SufU [Galactobacter caseinivorans]|uniref:SUF system NifU family Fe-S cluster assembly protein n=1 Tax=Galactobacter caseinivorans TaxID=2676123 RepID=A0A496PJK7_9MICC|nr:SUF system NifU family Fe-S cluster assembly protein [Galactobacter caseinivorans]RKW70666.1 SUF system NifU family Fe-S cluster assembly protein [Galactobacter caseinivorans]
MNPLEQLYQDIILDHSKRRIGADALETEAGEREAQSHQHNPLCGDDITLRARVAADGTIEALAWKGDGCSISMASASVLSESLTGHSVAEFDEANEAFHELMRSRGKIQGGEELEERLGDAAAFAGVSKFPARVKCALLSWEAARDAIGRASA